MTLQDIRYFLEEEKNRLFQGLLKDYDDPKMRDFHFIDSTEFERRIKNTGQM